MDNIFEAYGSDSSVSDKFEGIHSRAEGGDEQFDEAHFAHHTRPSRLFGSCKEAYVYDDHLTEEDEQIKKVKYLKGSRFDEALLNFYMQNKVKRLKRKLTSSRIDKFKKQKPEVVEPTTFTRYSGSYFSSVVKLLTPHQRAVIEKYGGSCMLKFEKTDVPLRFVKWIAGKFDTRTSEIQVSKDFIPITKETVHNILELPIGGPQLVSNSFAGKSFILSHFNVTTIPQVSYFGNKLRESVMKHDLSKYVFDWLIKSIKKFQKATKCAARRQITLGGNHYSLAIDAPPDNCGITIPEEQKLSSIKDIYKDDTSTDKIAMQNIDQLEDVLANSLISLFSSCLADEKITRICDIVRIENVGKSKEVAFHRRNVVCDVLKSLFLFHDKSKADNNFHDRNDVKGYQSDSATLKISSNDNGSCSSRSFDLNLTISNGKLVSGKYQRLSKLVNLSEFGSRKAMDDNGETEITNVDKCQEIVHEHGILNEAASNKMERSSNITHKEDFSKSPITPACPIDIIDSQQINSVPPMRKVKPKSKNSEQGNEKSTQYKHLDDIHLNSPCLLHMQLVSGTSKEDAVNLISPIVPVTLSTLFQAQRTQSGQYPFLLKKTSIDLTSPVCDLNKVHVIEDSPDQFNTSQEVQITGITKFDERCNVLSKEASDAYNKLLRYNITGKKMAPNGNLLKQTNQMAIQISHSSKGKENRDPMMTQTKQSSENLQADDKTGVVVAGSSSRSNGVLMDEAVRYDKAYCSFESLATLQPFGHVDNYVILVLCRKLFLDRHHVVTKKHCFFSYIGETILKFNGHNGDVVQNAFEGANSAFKMWRAEQLTFPICLDEHWFVFSVCLKAKYFAFLDSLYGSNSQFHQSIDLLLIENFVHLWNILVAPLMSNNINFNDFDIVHPFVPRQTNSDDCGVFTMKIMEGWTPRVHLQNIISSDDILNVRIKLANEIYFSKHNSLDKTIVSEFFGEVGM